MNLKQNLTNYIYSNNRFNYIINYLQYNKIDYKIDQYSSLKNIIIEFNEGFYKKKPLVLMAHYDILNIESHSANDNSSSVIVLLELARSLNNNKCKNNIVILLNDNEEKIGIFYNKDINIDIKNRFVNEIGSLFFINKYKSLYDEFIILELCGRGDSLYISDKSGQFESDKDLLNLLNNIAKTNNFPFINITVGISDLFSVASFNKKGCVIGTVNGDYKAAENPLIWNNIHTAEDSIDKIEENSLKLVYNFLLKITNTRFN